MSGGDLADFAAIEFGCIFLAVGGFGLALGLLVGLSVVYLR